MNKENVYREEILDYLDKSEEFEGGTFIPLEDDKIAGILHRMHVPKSVINKGFLIRNLRFASILLMEKDIKWETIQVALRDQYPNQQFADKDLVDIRTGRDEIAYYMSLDKCLKEEALPFQLTPNNELIVLVTEPKDLPQIQQILNFTRDRINSLLEKEMQEKLETLNQLRSRLDRLNNVQLNNVQIKLCPHLAFFYAVVNNCSIRARRQIIMGKP